MPEPKEILMGALTGLDRASNNLTNIMLATHKINRANEQFNLDKKISNLKLEKLKYETSPEQYEFLKKQQDLSLKKQEATIKYYDAKTSQAEAESKKEIKSYATLADAVSPLLTEEERTRVVPALAYRTQGGVPTGETIDVGKDRIETLSMAKQVEALRQKGGSVSYAPEKGWSAELSGKKDDDDVIEKNRLAVYKKRVKETAETLARQFKADQGESMYKDEAIALGEVNSWIPAAEAQLKGDSNFMQYAPKEAINFYESKDKSPEDLKKGKTNRGLSVKNKYGLY
jgi:hypothetical protein